MILICLFSLFSQIYLYDFNYNFNLMKLYEKKNLIIYNGTNLHYLNFTLNDNLTFSLESFNFSNQTNETNNQTNETDSLTLNIEEGDNGYKINFFSKDNNSTYSFSVDKIVNYNQDKDDNDTIYFLDKEKNETVAISFKNNKNEIKNISLNGNNSHFTIKKFYSNVKVDSSIDISYGETIFQEYVIIPYNILLIGVFILLYGTALNNLALIFQTSMFIYFLIKDIFELLSQFNYCLLSLTACFISGILICLFFNFIESEWKRKAKTIIYGCTSFYFLFKSIFYYIIFFYPLDYIAYLIILLFSNFIGCALGVYINLLKKSNKYKDSKIYLLIFSSSISGSFHIIKSLSFIVGGYYSDILTIKHKLYFTESCRGKIILYIILQILLIVGSIFYQFIYIKYSEPINSDYESHLTQDSAPINIIPDSTQKLLDNPNSNDSINDEEEDNEINDQED